MLACASPKNLERKSKSLLLPCPGSALPVETRCTRWRRGSRRRTRASGLRTWGAGAEDIIATVHGGGANVLFLDSHVQWYLQKDLRIQTRPLVAEESAKQRLWNADNEPAKQW